MHKNIFVIDLFYGVQKILCFAQYVTIKESMDVKVNSSNENG